MPLVGMTVSHASPLVVAAVAVKLTVDPVLLLTETFCEAGSVPPCWKPKARVLGVTTNVAVEVMVRVTDTFAVPMEDEKVRAPEYVPVASVPGLTETVTLAGVVPAVGLAESQDPPLLVLTVVVNPTADPVVLRTVTLWEEGGVPPRWKLNDRVLGLAVKDAVAEVTLRVTET